MSLVRTIAMTLVLILPIGVARAGEFTFSWHEFTGSGTANLFDGGPPVTQSGSLSGADHPGASFSATDYTRPGSMGALASAYGISQISTLGDLPDRMSVRVYLNTIYLPSFFPGGDNPGGMAEGSLSSVIEFVMPADEIYWTYGLRIEQDDPFEGFTRVVFENVTQTETLLTLTSAVSTIETVLSADIGDLMRLTTIMSGTGTMGPGSDKDYESSLGMLFVVPEPGKGAPLLLGLVIVVLTGRRRGDAVNKPC